MKPIGAIGGWRSASVDRLILAIIFGAALIFYGSIQLHHDVAWYAYCNLRQLEGMRPYVDVIEVSPPIVFCLTLPPVAAAAATGLSVKVCIAIYVLGLTAFSLALAMAADGAAAPAERRWKTVAAATVLTVAPIAVFAQREHFAVLLALPYLYAAAARRGGRRVAVGMAIIAGLMAGVGLSIKHYFLLVPVMVEAYLMWRAGTFRSVLRLEVLGAVIAGLIHAAFVLILYPEYLSVSVPLALASYGAYSIGLLTVAAQPWCMAAGFGIVFWLVARRRTREVPTADVLFVAAVAFYLCIFWQGKGWGYHALPSGILLALSAIELVVATVSGRSSSGGLPPRLRWIMPAAPIALILVQTVASGPYRNQFALDAAGLVRRLAPGGHVFMMSSKISSGFPLVLDANAKWASRFSTQWILPAVMRGIRERTTLDHGQRARLDWLKAVDMDATVADFEKYKPDIVFVDRAYQDEPALVYGGVRVDMLAHYLTDLRFAKIWDQYRKVETLSTCLFGRDQKFEVWVRGPEIGR